ncbi:MAG: S-methyl-5'-thioadenosine phosphorylase [Anaerolineales bacterium]|nr:S-methyl-5'-thioadenosine phosphorylase [Anaerolineales bacterium]
METSPVLGILGGSGLYAMQNAIQVEVVELDTPFGNPSSSVVIGDLNGKRFAFIARHGEGHIYSPAEVNYRANIYAMKMLGVKHLISVSACGSLREDYAPGDIVVPDQLFDRTEGRHRSFFGDGLVAHVNVADPFCPVLSNRLVKSVEESGGVVHDSGTFITIPGPRFSTKAESNTYRAWGMSIIGMTCSPEAFLAREAEMCYASMAHVTDYDVWHTTEEPVTVERIIQTLQANTKLAQSAIALLLEQHTEEWECDCGDALKDALITNPEFIPSDTRRRLSILVERYLS